MKKNKSISEKRLFQYNRGQNYKGLILQWYFARFGSGEVCMHRFNHKILLLITVSLFMFCHGTRPVNATSQIVGVKYQNGLVTIEKSNAPLHIILSKVAELAGIEIYVFNALSEEITVSEITAEPLAAALSRLLRGIDYAVIYSKDNSVSGLFVSEIRSSATGNNIFRPSTTETQTATRSGPKKRSKSNKKSGRQVLIDHYRSLIMKLESRLAKTNSNSRRAALQRQLIRARENLLKIQ